MADQLRQDLVRAAQARELIEHPVFSAAEAAVRQAITRQWAESPVRDIEGQHELRLMLKLLDDLLLNIKSAINDGALAKVEIERKSKLERMRRTWAA